MKKRMIARAAPLLLCACLAGAQAHPTTQARPGSPGTQGAEKKDTGGIRGCVVAGDTEGPLREATVQAVATPIGVVRSTGTDAQGCYAFANLPAARYVVQASKAAYATLQFGEDPLSGREGQMVSVSDGKTPADVNFRLPKAGVITGRVVDDAGEPVPNVLVQAMAVVPVSGDEERTAFPHAPSARTTNDLGRYRLFGLPAGDYVVSASPGNRAAKIPAELAGFVQTYFPGTLGLAEAVVLSVKPGQELQNVDIVLAAAPPPRK